jgi:hypothetical protein
MPAEKRPDVLEQFADGAPHWDSMEKTVKPKYFNFTAEPACLPCWHRQAEDAEDDEISPLDSGTTGLGTRNSSSRARMREGPIPHGFVFSAISAVKNSE